MRKKSDTTILFRKNHIEILRGAMSTSIGFKPRISEYPIGNQDRSYYIPSSKRKEKMILKSPLGFYYEKTVTVQRDNNKGKFKATSKGINYRIWLPDATYSITYLTSYGDSHIGKGLDGLRPWGIDPSDKEMSDHFIEDLKKELDKIIDVMRGFKFSEDIEEFKRKLYSDIFGFPEGPKYQTDLEKIESHGFDKALSFRKRKVE